MRHQGVAPIVFAALLVGCMPYLLHDTPSASGRVLDAVSGEPIRGATVIASESYSNRSISTKTGSDGKFELAAGTHWIAAPLGPFDPIQNATISITTPGYRQFKRRVSPYKSWGETVRLEPGQ